MVARLSASADREVVALDIDQVDLTDRSAVRDALLPNPAQWIINTAAMTNVDGCESASEKAHAINAEAVRYLAEICTELNAALVHISTDYVFDGQSPAPHIETDPTNPLGVYGQSKLAGEQYAASTAHHLIVRTAWLYGPGAPNFIKTILTRAAAGTPLRVVNDQTGSPTYAPDLAECIDRLMRAGAEGIYHVTNTGHTTWYDFASHAITLAGITAKIDPVPTTEYPTPAKRPTNSTLDTTKYTRTTSHTPRDWPEALADYIHHRTSV